MSTMTQLTDEALVKLYINGCNEAFDALLLRHKDRLYSYILYFTKNADVADDLFQETFVKAFMTLRQGRYTEGGKFYAWLTRIAHNLLIDTFRTEKSTGVVYTEETGNELQSYDELMDVCRETELISAQTLEDVKRLMEHLPEAQREVVFMRFYQELSFKEISEITGVSINTALGRMRYALMNMRKMAEDNHISLL